MPPLLRRLGRQDPGRDDPDQRQLPLLHAPRAGGGGGAGDPVELPDPDGGLEVGAGAGRRLHDRDQAGRADAADLPALGPAGAKSGNPRRRDQCRSRLRADGRGGACQPSGHRQDRLHRLRRDGADHHAAGGNEPQAADVRARGEKPQHRLCRCRSRCGGGGGAPRHPSQPGAVLLRRVAAVRRGLDPRCLRGARRGAVAAAARR